MSDPKPPREVWVTFDTVTSAAPSVSETKQATHKSFGERYQQHRYILADDKPEPKRIHGGPCLDCDANRPHDVSLSGNKLVRKPKRKAKKRSKTK
jgi:hypothetical protein